MIKTIILFAITIITLLAAVPLGLVLFALGCVGLKKPVSFLMYQIARNWARVVIFFIHCPMTVTGTEYIPKKGGLCFVSNHVGIFDIILALAYAGRPFGFIAKRELLLLPGINIWIYFLGGLFIDRGHPRKALKTIHSGVKQIKAGGSMLIFPEGTRSRGREIGAFHPGSLKLASQSEALIVPMAITGSYGIFEEHRRVKAVPVTIAFLPPVNPVELPPQYRKQLLAEKLHDDIEQALQNQKTNRLV